MSAASWSRLPIEQTRQWADLDSVTGDREVGAYFVARRKADTVAVMYATKMKSSGIQYLWARNGPVWVNEPSDAEEDELLTALRHTVRKEFPLAAFLRLHSRPEAEGTRPIISTITFDATVVLDLEGDDEQILSKFKSRGRRDVRKSMRESSLEVRDETENALADFSPYYEVMQETAKRDGFFPPEKHYFESILKSLGRDRSMIVAARAGDELGAWSLLTMSDGGAQRMYAATNELGLQERANDLMVYKEALLVRDKGCTTFDLMGIGSDLSPSLLSLNEFKTKFSNEIKQVRPARDLALHRSVTALLSLRRDVKDKLARYQMPESTREAKFLPVIIGGGIGLRTGPPVQRRVQHARHLHLPRAVAGDSPVRLHRLGPTGRQSTPEGVLSILEDVAEKHPDKKLVLMTNADPMIDKVVTIREQLPKRMCVLSVARNSRRCFR